jgi:uncharacterized membrane protein
MKRSRDSRLRRLFGWPSIIAVIINHVKRSEVRGTYLESHFRWQIRTFWYALLWAILVALVSVVLLVAVVGIAAWIVGLALLGIWAIYRIARDWLALKDGQPMPVEPAGTRGGLRGRPRTSADSRCEAV